MDYANIKSNEWCIQIPHQYINYYDQIMQLINTMDKKPIITKIDYDDVIVLEFVFENQSQNLLFQEMLKINGYRFRLSFLGKQNNS